jgi:hypothetical protein
MAWVLRFYSALYTFEALAKRQGLLGLRKKPFLLILTYNFAPKGSRRPGYLGDIERSSTPDAGHSTSGNNQRDRGFSEIASGRKKLMGAHRGLKLSRHFN